MPDDRDQESRALVAATGAGRPPLVLARTLEQASPHMLVHIDGRGQVRSPTRYRAIAAIAYGVSGAAAAGSAVVYGALLGLPGYLIGGGLALYLGWLLDRNRLLNRASVHLVHDQLDEAEALLQRVVSSRLCNKNVRAMALHHLGVVAARRGDHARALEHLRAALTLHARWRRRAAPAQLTEYAELVTLVNLGRVAEARQRLEQKRGVVPAGNYLRLHHWVAELYLCFAEGGHRLDAEALHERARAALGITGAAALLALCAWAHRSAGDCDQAAHLLREAFDRRSGQRIEQVLPRLHAWMEEHRAEAELLG